jgi:hypothetical protein
MGALLSIQAVGACAPIGLSILPIAAAERAGIKRFVETQVSGPRGDAIVASRLSTLDPDSARSKRLCQLLRHAARDCIGQMRERSRVKVILCLPEALKHETGLAAEAFKIMETAIGCNAEPRVGSSVRDHPRR